MTGTIINHAKVMFITVLRYLVQKLLKCVYCISFNGFKGCETCTCNSIKLNLVVEVVLDVKTV